VALMFQIMSKSFVKDKDMTPNDIVVYGLDHIDAGFKLFGDPTHFDSGGYLIHIGYECILKGWWLELNGSFIEGHDLIKITENIPLFNYKSLPSDIQKTIDLVNSYKFLRYPNHQSPTEVGTEDLEPIQDLVSLTLKLMPSKLYERKSGQVVTKGKRVLMKKKIE